MALTGSSLLAATAFVGDDFQSFGYNGQTAGSLNWVSPWIEFKDANQAPFTNKTTGGIYLSRDALAFGKNATDNVGNSLAAGASIVRALNLENKTSVTVTFTVAYFSRAGKTITMQLWNNVDSVWVDKGTYGTIIGAVSIAITDPKLLSVDSKIRFLNATGSDWTGSNDQIRLDDIKISFDYADTDGDGKPNDADLDDDNDGILDTIERSSQADEVDVTRAWTRVDDNNMKGTLGTLEVALSDVGNILDPISASYDPVGAFNPFSKGFWSSDTKDSLQAAPSAYLSVNTPSSSQFAGDVKITLPKATKRVLIHVDRLGNYNPTSKLSESARFTLKNAASFVMSMGNSNGNLKVDSANKYFERILNVPGQSQNDSSDGANHTTNASAAGTIIIESNTAFTELLFNAEYLGANGSGKVGTNGFYMIIETDTTRNGSKDSDHDGVSDEFDLDSDNDGIPDSIEAQATPNPVYIDIVQFGVDANGIPTQANTGFTPQNSDTDSTPDFLDSDSDGDDIPDCAEGNVNTMANCPITTVTADGMSALAGSDGNYGKIHGNVNDVTTDLFAYVSPEVAYRVALVCGSGTWNIKAQQWQTISLPCNTTDSIDAIFVTLGTYGENADWVMYEQSNDYSGTSSSMVQMLKHFHMTAGQGYWIIANADHNVSVPPANTSITTKALPVNHSVTSPNFTEVHNFITLPDSNGAEQKVLLGNPFPVPFHIGDLFVSNNSGSNYYPLYDTANTAFTNKIVYVYDNTNNYVAKTAAGTPGFGDAIAPGVGFWYRLIPGQGSNKVDYPFNK